MPLTFALLMDKSGATYELLLSAMLDLMPGFAPRLFISDHVAGVIITAVAAVLPGTTHQGCYSHLGQSLYRRLQQAGLQQMYQTDEAVRFFYRKLLPLGFIPLDNVVQVFYDLQKAPNDLCRDVCL